MYTMAFVMSPLLMLLPLLYPKTLGNKCPQFKYPSLLLHFPMGGHLVHFINNMRHNIGRITFIWHKIYKKKSK
jgi:hypothetical protein